MLLESKLYYGLPEELWHDLIFQAEDLLRDEELGSHIVGVFPAGGRIFGLESESPGILCLYIDSVEALIDPFLRKDNPIKTFHVGHSNNKIIMADIWSWAKSLININLTRQQSLDLVHLIPFGNAFHIDSSVEQILEIAKEWVTTSGLLYMSGSLGKYIQTNIVNKLEVLALRTMYIFDTEKSFYPCVNKEWDYVHEEEDIAWLLEDNNEDKIRDLYSEYFYHTVTRPTITKGDLQQKLGSEVARLYRSLV